MGALGLIWGIIAFIAMLVAWTPCLGALNWLILPFAGIGILISGISMAQKSYVSRNSALAGLVLNLLAFLLGLLRLFLGGGLL